MIFYSLFTCWHWHLTLPCLFTFGLATKCSDFCSAKLNL